MQITDSRIQDFTELYSFLYEKVGEYTEVILLMLLSHYQKDNIKMALVIDKEITFMATIIQILNII